MKHLSRLCLVGATLTVLLGCSQLHTPDESYVRADRATYDVVAPVIRLLADSDPTNDPVLTGSNGLGLIQVITTWEARIRAAEARHQP